MKEQLNRRPVTGLDVNAMKGLVKMIESRLRYLESIKFTTRDDEGRVAEMHQWEIVWANLIHSIRTGGEGE